MYQQNNIHGLNGFLKKFWNKLKDRFNRAIGAGKYEGKGINLNAISIWGVVQDLVNSISSKSQDLPAKLQSQFDLWVNNVMTDLTFNAIDFIMKTPTSILISASGLSVVNRNIKTITVLKAYYEWKLSRVFGDEALLLNAKIETINSTLDAINTAFYKATETSSSQINTTTVSFSGLTYKNIGGEVLNWTGLKTLTVKAIQFRSKATNSKPTGTTTTSGSGKPTNTKPSGTFSTGGSKTDPKPAGGLPGGPPVLVNPTKPTSGDVLSTGKPTITTRPTNTNTKPQTLPVDTKPNYPSNDGSVQTGVVVTQQPTQQNNGASDTNKSNKNIWLAFAALAALVLVNKSN